ncbi:PREDICTED: monocopper oxidase-like protein SKU5 [Nicotiana attenuata]|uniref:monocopper oxidase-like protein SKU5 n=1 Tax=Nicotiana attenuata TaxID=49451 RepID=UPI000905227E|nr:PREDICTED: monocopper oxidase-like protein SKU5 [Nicotiana attenuata]
MGKAHIWIQKQNPMNPSQYNEVISPIFLSPTAIGKTYRLRISNVGSEWSFNFRIQNHSMLLVETEGSYTNQITLESLDVHVGQSYSVLVTADQDTADYYIVATAKMANSTQLKTLEVVGVLHYENSTKPADGPLPNGPDPFDVHFSISQARSIRWNLTTGAARPNPQGSFNVSNVTLSQTFVLQNSVNKKNGMINYAINNVSYDTPQTPLKLADYYLNGGAGVYELDKFPANSSLPETVYGTFVVSGEHKGWLEIVFKNELKVMDSWHLDGFGFFVVGYGFGNWNPESRCMYNLFDPVVRSTVQVYPKGWTAVYVYLDNPGMWNLRSQNLKHWFSGQELYIRVYDSDPNPAKEHPPPKNLLYCGSVQAPPSAPPPSPKPVPAPPAPVSPSSAAATATIKRQWSNIIEAIFVLLIIWDGSWCL